MQPGDGLMGAERSKSATCERKRGRPAMLPGNSLMGAERSKLTTCERFIMVVHHWSNDGMVIYHR